MKICRINYTYAPFQLGGGDIYTSKISRALSSRHGVSDVVISIAPDGVARKDMIEGVTVYRLKPRNVSTFHTIGKQNILQQGVWTLLDLYNPFMGQEVAGIIAAEKPDLVHIHTPSDLTLSIFDAAARYGCPVVLTLHDYLFMCRRFVLLHGEGSLCTRDNVNPLCLAYRGFTRGLLRRTVTTVIAPSKFVLDYHRQNGFFDTTLNVVLPHGIEFTPRELEGQPPARPETKGTFDILYTGGLTKPKGVHVLIDAFAALDIPSAMLHIVGGGSYERELFSKAAGIPGIRFYGKIGNAEIQDFYARADVSVVPSLWNDVRPNVIPEAFRKGLPVIGARMGGIPELVIDGKTGFLFDAGDVACLARVLRMCASNRSVLRAAGHNAFLFVKQFSMDAYLDRLIETYEKTLTRAAELRVQNEGISDEVFE